MMYFQSWGPHFLLDKRKLERVQRHATTLVPQLSDKIYQHCLLSLDLYTTEKLGRIIQINKWSLYFGFFTLSPNVHMHLRKFIETL